MIKFNIVTATQCKNELSTLFNELNGIKSKLSKIINSEGYYGGNDGLLEFEKIILLNEKLCNFVSESVRLYNEFYSETEGIISSLDSSDKTAIAFTSQLSQLAYMHCASTLVVSSRNSRIEIIGDTKCLVSLPSFENYNGEKLQLVVYAPGATECDYKKLIDNNYMDGLFGNNSDLTNLSYVIVIPLELNVDSKGNGISFETGGKGLTEEEYGYYAEFIKDAAYSSYTNSAGQTLLIDANSVILAGFSQGTRKQLGLIERLISNNSLNKKIGDVHFDEVILATSGKYGIESLTENLRSNNVNNTRLEEFKDSVIYITAEGDTHDLSNENGAKYTEYNNTLKKYGLIDNELSEAYMASLSSSELPRSATRNFTGRTTYVGRINSISGHEAAREAIVGVLEVMQQNATNGS